MQPVPIALAEMISHTSFLNGNDPACSSSLCAVVFGVSRLVPQGCQCGLCEV